MVKKNFDDNIILYSRFIVLKIYGGNFTLQIGGTYQSKFTIYKFSYMMQNFKIILSFFLIEKQIKLTFFVVF